MVRRNVFISYILAFSKNTWFWLGIWIFYYLRFTNYAGIGIIETVLVVTVTLSEIPTGAIADLLGKKKTLMMAFFFEALGAFTMASALNFPVLAFSVFLMCIGGALYSGTIDALLFDTLKQNKQEDGYSKKISNISTISLIAPAICGIIGGFMYKIHPSLPFWANGVGYTIGFLASIFLIEPVVDTEKFSLKNFMFQTRYGVKELFKNKFIKRQTIFLLSVGFFVVIASEMLNSFLGAEFGFKPEGLSILWSLIFIISAVASQATPFFLKKFKNKTTIILGILFAMSFLISPFVGIVIGGISLAFRSSLEGIFNNLASITINNNTESKYRATTISSFNMIKNIPYVASAYFIGSLSDKLSARNTAMYLGLILGVFIVIQIIFSKKNRLPYDSNSNKGN